jgi:hypothetical protein
VRPASRCTRRIAVDLFDGKAFGAIIGAGAGIGPRLGGRIHDWTGELIFAFSARAGADVNVSGFYLDSVRAEADEFAKPETFFE